MKDLIVVTGAAGMIGSGVVRCLNDRGYKRLLLIDDLKKNDKWKNLVGKEFLNLVSRHRMFEALKEHESDIDAVIHLGACSDTVETDADYLLENNYHFSVRLAEWALTHNKRFIYASSAATYGDGALGFSDDEESISQLKPLNMYAFSKQLVDLWMKREGGFKKAVGLKYFNVFGPNEYHKGRMASMVLKMMNKVKDDGIISLFQSNDPQYGDGDQCRDFIYVKDAVRMTCDLLEHRHVTGLLNIGLGVATTWNQLSHALFQALGKPTNIEYIPLPPDLARQYQNYTCADMKKFLKLLPQTRTTSVDAAVREYVQEYLSLSARW